METRTVKIGLSTSSVFPESTAAAFELAALTGFEGVEIMVGMDAMSQDSTVLRNLVQHYQLPILSLHAPCLLVTQRVWGTDSWGKLDKAREVAELVGAETVVVHPPFRWQRDYAKNFEAGIAELNANSPVGFTVENMYPWRAGPGSFPAYSPDWDIRNQDYENVTLDFSHTAVSQTDPLDMIREFGHRLKHIHLADGTDSASDEHLVPGRGTQPVREGLEALKDQGFNGSIVAEISTRSVADREERIADLQASIEFVRAVFPIGER
ncbi:MAG: sugar phosphate isomerase/epimerase [Actinomycetia bacterium]|nr:sugar phosphate isomerase/epimerase [Actinomycetes bacterium]